MRYNASMFCHILQMVPRSTFRQLVRETRSEQHSKGFSRKPEEPTTFLPLHRAKLLAGGHLLLPMSRDRPGRITPSSQAGNLALLLFAGRWPGVLESQNRPGRSEPSPRGRLPQPSSYTSSKGVRVSKYR